MSRLNITFMYLRWYGTISGSAFSEIHFFSSFTVALKIRTHTHT